MITAIENNISTKGLRRKIFIDAGIEFIRFKLWEFIKEDNREVLSKDIKISNNGDLYRLLEESGILNLINNSSGENGYEDNEIFISGKLSQITRKILNRGEIIMPAAAIWSAAKYLIKKEENLIYESLGIIDLSASGYMVICIDRDEKIIKDTLIVNPKCGAGTGINLSRIMEKLNISRDTVDIILKDYLGEAGKEKRLKTVIRADRCGVFSSSATISDKNQGIPLDHALAVTMKSEVKKACERIPSGIDKVYLTGGVFNWQIARDAARDFLELKNIKAVADEFSVKENSENQSIIITGMKNLVENLDSDFRKQSREILRKPESLITIPAFELIKEKYEKEHIYARLSDPQITLISPEEFINTPVNIALDIGSTMAKMVIADAKTGQILFKNSFNNHGDTIETIRYIFKNFQENNIDKLKILNIGITGSGRYQVQKSLQAIYPHLKDNISALVENYAHARGSIEIAKQHIQRLKKRGSKEINEDFFMLVDIGGEDTKISIVSLKKQELFDNAMNTKCSAGTGSLMDTLKTLFGIKAVKEAYSMAQKALKSYGINATCAVFLMENARKMQAEGYGKDEILASCCHSIVENMARTLWDQVDIPKNSIILLHGQTMLSDPLPLAVTHRIQKFVGAATYCLVPPFPGHRACIGLIKTMEAADNPVDYEKIEFTNLDDFISQKFAKRIFYCHHAACGDKSAKCARTILKSNSAENSISLKLGGCTSVNEMESRKKEGKRKKVVNSYKEIWEFIDKKQPKSTEANRVVIPRSFSISSEAFFLAKIFEKCAIPVYCDNIRESDITTGQPFFKIDTCAPNIGVTGQLLRLAENEKGIILLPQIDFLDTGQKSLGRTCTTNQGGIIIAFQNAKMKFPDAKFALCQLTLKNRDPDYIADQLFKYFADIFSFYNKKVSKDDFREAIRFAGAEKIKLQDEISDKVCGFIEEAINENLNISIITGREYILNPGIYDSHIGKLLRDKAVITIPAYTIDTHLDEKFNFVYWKNPHDIITKIKAITDSKLHKIIKHPRLQKLIKKIETGITGSMISLVTVSTFRCGPDTVTQPIISEIAKDRPSLFIQSDAMIAELAHLENRVNTHLNQLEKKLHLELASSNGKMNFEIAFLEDYSLDGLDIKSDVLYFPTLGDNRTITSIFRASGVTTIDNYDDDSFDLEQKAKQGRQFTGDSVCTPLAAVYADMLNAIEDFDKRKRANDPLVKDKKRVVVFMHGGDGPCRLGKYTDVFKILFHRKFGNVNNGNNGNKQKKGYTTSIRIMENLMSGLQGKKDHYLKIEKWAALQAFHSTVIHGILYSIFFKALSFCKDEKQYKILYKDWQALKQKIYQRLEKNTRPNKFLRKFIPLLEKIAPPLGGLGQYFGYGLYNNNGMRKILKSFNARWIANREKNGNSKKIKIHVDGEVYMRVAQIQEISKSLIDSIGYGSFELTQTPLWCVFEIVLEERIRDAQSDILTIKASLENNNGSNKKKKLLKSLKAKNKFIKSTNNTVNNLRNILAKPLYDNAGVSMPPEIKDVLQEAKKILPFLKPVGELCPYVGEVIIKLQKGSDLILNVAPEGCMVSSMGEALTPKIMEVGKNSKGRVQHLFSNDGEVDDEIIRLALLKTLGPERYYKN